MDKSKQIVLHALGALVRQYRLSLDISQEELGFRSGLDRTYISGVERGKRNPSFTALVSLSAGLGLTLSDLLNGLEEQVLKDFEHDKDNKASNPNSH